MSFLIFEKKNLEINLFNELNFWWLPIWGEVHEIGWIQLWEFGIFIYFGVSKDVFIIIWVIFTHQTAALCK